MRERITLASIATIICVFLGSISMSPVSGTVDSDISESNLLELISENEDPRITDYDLAFFLVTHNYDSTPMDECVQVKIDGAIYELIPNGERPDLADLIEVA